MSSLNPLLINDVFLTANNMELAYDKEKDFCAWKKETYEKLRELIGTEPKRVPLNIRVEYIRKRKLYKEIRYIFTSEKECDVPCHLLIPSEGVEPFPLVICLQGHSSGMHISLGVDKYKGDRKEIDGDRDFAIQAIKQGYAALVLEQRCFGERMDDKVEKDDFHSINRCHIASLSSLLIGRTMIGERVWDVSRAIDSLAKFGNIDINRIGCMGNSGGGTIAFYSTCMDERIKVCMPSCYVCALEYSLMKMKHCICNYIPNMLKYFDLGDLAGLIAPRPLVIVAGRQDDIFPFAGVKKSYKNIEEIYDKLNASENLRLVVGEEGHRFYAEPGWKAFKEIVKW